MLTGTVVNDGHTASLTWRDVRVWGSGAVDYVTVNNVTYTDWSYTTADDVRIQLTLANFNIPFNGFD